MNVFKENWAVTVEECKYYLEVHNQRKERTNRYSGTPFCTKGRKTNNNQNALCPTRPIHSPTDGWHTATHTTLWHLLSFLVSFKLILLQPTFLYLRIVVFLSGLYFFPACFQCVWNAVFNLVCQCKALWVALAGLIGAIKTNSPCVTLKLVLENATDNERDHGS